jgi:hypothetical protein
MKKTFIMFKVYECIVEPSITKVNIYAKTLTHAFLKLEYNVFETIYFYVMWISAYVQLTYKWSLMNISGNISIHISMY